MKTESPNRVRMRASCRAFARFAWRRLAKILCCQLCCCPLVFWRTAVYFRFNIYIWKLNMLQSYLMNENQSPEKNNWNSFGRLLFKVKKSKLFFLVLGGVNGIIFINIQLECKCTFTKKYLSKYHQYLGTEDKFKCLTSHVMSALTTSCKSTWDTQYRILA